MPDFVETAAMNDRVIPKDEDEAETGNDDQIMHSSSNEKINIAQDEGGATEGTVLNGGKDQNQEEEEGESSHHGGPYQPDSNNSIQTTEVLPQYKMQMKDENKSDV